MANTSVALQEAEEIDLLELIQALWVQKFLIIGVALLVTFAGGAYAFLSKPVYEARVYLLPPTYNGIAEFNFGRTKEAELVPFTVKDVYDVFARNLQSESLRHKFFDDVYLPSLDEKQKNEPRDSLYADFSKSLVVESPPKDAIDRYSIVVQSSNPAEAAEWVRDFAARAGDAAKKEMIRNVSREAEVRARNLGQQITTLQENGKKTLADSVIQLREALRISEAVGLENPPIISGDISSEVSASMDGQLTYMRGAKALRAEIKNLEDRKSNDPFIEKLRALQIKQSFYQGLTVSPESVAVYRQDGSIEQPDKPIKPKKGLILIVATILGGAIGLVIALIRIFKRRGYHEGRF